MVIIIMKVASYAYVMWYDALIPKETLHNFLQLIRFQNVSFYAASSTRSESGRNTKQASMTLQNSSLTTNCINVDSNRASQYKFIDDN